MNPLLALFATAMLTALPADVEVPKNDGWVTDLAGILNQQQEQELELLMESYKQGSTHEIALLTVPDMGGETIERYALEVAVDWGLGTREAENGALLVVAKEERKIRIEVGRGLEGTLPDAIASRIIHDVIRPSFKAGDFAGGLRNGVMAMHSAIGGDYGPIERTSRGRRGAGSVGSIFTLLFFFFIFFIGRGRRGRGGSVWPWLFLAGSMSGGRRSSWHGGGGSGGGFGGGGGFSGFGGGGGFSGGGASGGW